MILMRRLSTVVFTFASLTFLFLVPDPVLAVAPCRAGVEDASGAIIAGSEDILPLACLDSVITNVVSWAFVLLGTAAVLMLLWGAIRFITSGGDPKAIQSAQKTMTYALIGAGVVLGAFLLINTITNALNLPSVLSNFSLFSTFRP